MISHPNIFLLIFFLFLATNCLISEVETCACNSSGQIRAEKHPPGVCNTKDSSACCVEGQTYDLYDCSPHVSRHTKANLTLNSFDRGGNDGGPSDCDNLNHSDDELVVALSTGWYDQGKRCLKYINIRGNRKHVMAKVIDQCDSRIGCDCDKNYEPPCDNNIVSASRAVWLALGVPQSQWGRMDIHWSDA
ncbi:hypothetical protein REPUB_Repub17cG0161500 [Reevesia pubescens]